MPFTMTEMCQVMCRQLLNFFSSSSAINYSMRVACKLSENVLLPGEREKLNKFVPLLPKSLVGMDSTCLKNS